MGGVKGVRFRAISSIPMRSRGKSHLPKLGEAEIAALHVRVIALENLVIALLSAPPDRKLEVAREMAAYIAPRPGFTRHPLTVHAATHMLDLVERAARFEGRQPS